AVAYTRRGEGFEGDAVEDGESALAATRSQTYDVLVLDLMLPGLSGLEVCRRVRAESNVPILMLTARTAEVDRVVGLDAGADDYVSKPFSMAELVSRVRAILRRRDLHRSEVGDRTHRVGDLHGTAEVRRRLTHVVEGGARYVLVDLLGAGLLDSAGLGVLVATAKTLRSAGGQLVLVADDRRILRTIQIAGLDGLLRVEPSL